MIPVCKKIKINDFKASFLFDKRIDKKIHHENFQRNQKTIRG